MALFLVLVFLVAPVVELAVIVQVAGSIGALNTIGLLVAVSLVGAWLAKHQGLGVLRRIQAALDRGEVPSSEVADGGLILLAGALMIAPGFVSDAVAVLLLLPPTRALVRVPLMRWIVRRGPVTVVSRVGARRDPGAAGVWDVESWESTPDAPARGELRDPS
ncbi:MAG TPA: FxsA family protein [Acidimicrobiales bacterium]